MFRVTGKKSIRKLLKHEQCEAPPRLVPAVSDLPGTADVDEDVENSTDRTKPFLLLTKKIESIEGELLDRKDEIQRLIKISEQEMPQLDNETQNTACGQDNGTDPESVATSSEHSDDTPPRLTAAQANTFLSTLLDGDDSRGEHCDDNASPPPLDKYASTSSPSATVSVMKDSTSWSLRLRKRQHQFPLPTSEAGPSANKNCLSETQWVDRLVEVLEDFQPSQLLLARETVHSTMVRVLAQEITSDLSCLMSIIESEDRRAAAFERVLSDLKKFKVNSSQNSVL
ncbi:unnamed protein product [Thelazia callipaeda]|uniref:DUF1409 domain-containing protein n=1 Tax=Thelazia callipaeda TaxID=103827 RepID=A0A0N5D874_THECL|nr:unnamed protein product [Thelazia callipaeda]